MRKKSCPHKPWIGSSFQRKYCLGARVSFLYPLLFTVETESLGWAIPLPWVQWHVLNNYVLPASNFYSTKSNNTRPSGALFWLATVAHLPERANIYYYIFCKANLANAQQFEFRSKSYAMYKSEHACKMWPITQNIPHQVKHFPSQKNPARKAAGGSIKRALG